ISVMGGSDSSRMTSSGGSGFLAMATEESLKTGHCFLSRCAEQSIRVAPRGAQGGAALCLINQVATCVHCGADTQLFSGGMPICLACSLALSKKQQSLKPKPPQPERILGSVNSKLSATRAEYRRALALQIEKERLLDTLGPGSSDGKDALRSANEQLSVAAG